MERKEKEKPKVIIEDLERGPLLVTGKLIFRDIKRDIINQTDTIYLCRCGKSKNQPYCDDSHRK